MTDIQTEVSSSGGVMVCVTGQRSCERLINHGAKRKKDDQKLFIVHCVQTGHNFMNTTFEADAIEYLFTCALLVNAELTILRADSVMDALVDFAVEHNVSGYRSRGISAGRRRQFCGQACAPPSGC